MKIPFQSTPQPPVLRHPQPVQMPTLQGAHLAARYRAARVGGDYYDFVALPNGRLVFVFLDIAGKREEALNIAAALQENFRENAVRMLGGEDVNEADALAELLLEMNRTIMQAAGGVRCAPAFLGSFDEGLGTLMYCNAGHTPGMVKDSSGVTQLPASGLPLGLFSHATHDAQLSVLEPNAALVLVSKGLVEVRAGSREFGIERAVEVVNARSYRSAQDLCEALLDAAQNFSEQTSRFGPKLHIPGLSHDRQPNDHTTIALVRAPAVETVDAAAN